MNEKANIVTFVTNKEVLEDVLKPCRWRLFSKLVFVSLIGTEKVTCEKRNGVNLGQECGGEKNGEYTGVRVPKVYRLRNEALDVVLKKESGRTEGCKRRVRGGRTVSEGSKGTGRK